jgi:hypothetical protein
MNERFDMDTTQFQERMERIEELLAAVEEHANPVARASAVELVRTLLDVHRIGLSQIVEPVARHGAPGQAILKEWLQNDLISRLLLLHGLHPVDLETRLEQALDCVRPRLLALGARVELARVSHEVVALRVYAGSEIVHQLLHEAILAAAPDVLRIEFLDADAAGRNLISLPLIGRS